MSHTVLVSLLVSFLGTVTSINCNGFTYPVNGKSDASISYDLDKPSKKYKLPDKLEEISGLTYVGDGIIACIQDEKGKIHHYNLKNETVEEAFEFGEKGDYEGIEVIGKTAYVLRSDGTIFEIIDYYEGVEKVNTYQSILSSSNNTEGLGADFSKKNLLVACKEDAGEGKSYKGKKAVYAFNLKKKAFDEEPIYLIDKDDLKDPDKDSKHVDFKPSGIAIHPITKNVYLISTVGKLLVILDRKGNIISKHKLDKDVFKQPEGICFKQNGDLYISNEGRGKTPNILKFKYRKK